MNLIYLNPNVVFSLPGGRETFSVFFAMGVIIPEANPSHFTFLLKLSSL